MAATIRLSRASSAYRSDSEFVRLLIADRAEELAAASGSGPAGCLRFWRQAEREILRSLRRNSPPDRNRAAGDGSVAA